MFRLERHLVVTRHCYKIALLALKIETRRHCLWQLWKNDFEYGDDVTRLKDVILDTGYFVLTIDLTRDRPHKSIEHYWVVKNSGNATWRRQHCLYDVTKDDVKGALSLKPSQSGAYPLMAICLSVLNQEKGFLSTRQRYGCRAQIKYDSKQSGSLFVHEKRPPRWPIYVSSN